MQDLKLQDKNRKSMNRDYITMQFVVVLNTQQCDALGVNDYLLHTKRQRNVAEYKQLIVEASKALKTNKKYQTKSQK